MIVQFVNQQNKHQLQPWLALLTQVVNLAAGSIPWWKRLLGGPVEPAVTISLVGPLTMRRINRETRSVNLTTDVLSFPLVDMIDGKPAVRLKVQDYEHLENGRRLLPLGDIFICLDRAFEQALQYGHSQEREVSFLAVHGLLHILGYDHDTPVREKRMRRKQRQIMKLADTENMSSGLIRKDHEGETD